MEKVLKYLLAGLFVITAALVVWVVATGGSEVAISWSLIWGYALLIFAVVGVICAAIKGTITHPAGLKKTLLSALLVAAVVGTAVGIALSHDSLVIHTSAGGVFDDRFELVLAESGIIVTYIVAAATILATVGIEVYNAIKK